MSGEFTLWLKSLDPSGNKMSMEATRPSGVGLECEFCRIARAAEQSGGFHILSKPNEDRAGPFPSDSTTN